MPLPEPVQDLVRIGSESRWRRSSGSSAATAAWSSSCRASAGTVYRVAAGRLVEIVDETEETPGQHSQGGWSQARYQRHIEHLVQQHLKTVGQELDKQARRTGGLPVGDRGAG